MAPDFVLNASLEKVWTEETVLSSLVEQSKANRQDISLPGQQSSSSKKLKTPVQYLDALDGNCWL